MHETNPYQYFIGTLCACVGAGLRAGKVWTFENKYMSNGFVKSQHC